jgi:hypothetical protein
VSLKSRLTRLERVRPKDGRCPDCPPPSIIGYHQDGPEAEPVLDEGQELPGPCPRCGRPAEVLEIVEVVVSSWEEAQRYGP